MSYSRIISILAALGVACTGTATIAGGIKPLYAVILMFVGTFITLFCERLQGGVSKYEIVPRSDESEKESDN